jgi:hypothetical protein
MSENRELEKYKQQSINLGLPPRCPIASANYCPRYFKTISLLRESGLIAGLDESKEKEIEEYWKKTPFWLVPLEEEPAVAGPEGKRHIISNICPEIGYELFGIFSCFFAKYADEIDEGVACNKLRREKAPADDWRWHFSTIIKMHYSDCKEFSQYQAGLITPTLPKEKIGFIP